MGATAGVVTLAALEGSEDPAVLKAKARYQYVVAGTAVVSL